jgi:hypothetical protein
MCETGAGGIVEPPAISLPRRGRYVVWATVHTWRAAGDASAFGPLVGCVGGPGEIAATAKEQLEL